MMNKLAVIVVVFFALVETAVAQEWKVKVGDMTPRFEIELRDGAKVTSDELKGKVVLLNFFATWCPPCRKELPRLQTEIWEQLGNRDDFAVLVLAREQGWDKIDPFMQDHKYTFPVFPDLNRKVFSLFAEQSIPRNVVLDREGKIIYQSIGFQDDEFSQMVELIKNQLKK